MTNYQYFVWIELCGLCGMLLKQHAFFIWSQFHSISSVSTVGFCFQGNHISKAWCRVGGWNTSEAFEIKSIHKFSTVGFFNEQRESDLIVCIQIGPNFLQYRLLKIHFCLAVGYFEEEKKTCYSHYRWRYQHHNHRDHRNVIAISFTKVVCIFSPGVLFFFFFFSFWKHLIHYIYLLSVFISAKVSGHMSFYIWRKRHRILIFWPHNKLKCVKSLHFQSKADLIVVKCYLFYFRWENYSLSLLTLIWTVILSPPSKSTSAHEELCIISMELLLEECNLHRSKYHHLVSFT